MFTEFFCYRNICIRKVSFIMYMMEGWREGSVIFIQVTLL